MKISGMELDGSAHEEVFPLPHGEKIIPIRARSVPDMAPFEKLSPQPKPPGKLTKNGWVPNEGDEGYAKQIENWNRRRIGWLVIESLQDVEWQTVNGDDPSTFENWEKDLKEGGFSQVQCNLVLQTVLRANSLDEGKMEEARQLFLLGQAAETSSEQ